MLKEGKKESGKNSRLYELESEEGLSKNDCSDGEEENDSKVLMDYKKSFQVSFFTKEFPFNCFGNLVIII